MKRLAHSWRLFLRRLFILCSSGFLAAGACAEREEAVMYGMPAMYGMPSSVGPVPHAIIDGRVLAADTELAIPGIQATIIRGDLHIGSSGNITGERGYFVFYFSGDQVTNAESGTLLLEDIDGDKNGSFYNTNVSWDADIMLPYTIYMQRKESP